MKVKEEVMEGVEVGVEEEEEVKAGVEDEVSSNLQELLVKAWTR